MSATSPKPDMRNWSPTAIGRDLLMAWRLFWDPKVPSALKFFLPLAAIIYWFWVFDLIPIIFLDDIAVALVALRLFVKMATNASAKDAQGSQRGRHDMQADDENTIDTTWRVVDQDQ